jgi:hypothetical protein
VHFLLHCPHEALHKARQTLTDELSREAAHALLIGKLAEVLSPKKWKPDDNRLINIWCKNTLEMFVKAIVAEEHPCLANILMHSKCQSPILNENVENQVFMIKFRSGPYKGHWRLRAIDYDPFDHSFTLNSTNLDIRNGSWFSIPGQDLNDMFMNGRATHVPQGAYLLLPTIAELRNGVVMKENFADHCCEVKRGTSRRYKWANTHHYDHFTGLHTACVEGDNCALNLNALLLDRNKIRMPDGLLHPAVIGHIRVLVAETQSRTPASAVTSARPMPQGG